MLEYYDAEYFKDLEYFPFKEKSKNNLIPKGI